MSDETLVTLVGTVVKEDPILNFTPTGLPVTKFSIMVPGTKAKEGRPATERTFHDVVAWRELGENVAESVQKGDRVIVRGVIKTRTWDKQDGSKGTATELNAWNVGPDLSYATATVTRNERTEAPAAASVGADDGYGGF